MSEPRPRVSPRRTVVRLTAGLAAAAVAVLLGAGAASAHVHVDGEGATRGGYGVLTFRVPTESATASTTAVTVTMPSDTPIASASVEPVPGWTAKVTTKELATPVETDDGQLTTYVARIRWKADDAAAGIAPGEFQRFSVSVGPLPDVDELVFPTAQTYSDGTVVNWNETSSGTAEAEHPAPTLALAAAADDHHAVATADPETTAATSASVDGTGLAIGIAGTGIGIVALVIAIIALLRGSKRAGA